MSSKGQAPREHEWIMVANFAITQAEVDQLAAARVDPTGEGRHNVQLSQDTMISLDGPGCRQCGNDWTIAYGTSCPGRFDVGGEQVKRQLPTDGSPVAPEPPLQRGGSGLLLPNGQESGRGGLLLPEGMQMPSAE